MLYLRHFFLSMTLYGHNSSPVIIHPKKLVITILSNNQSFFLACLTNVGLVYSQMVFAFTFQQRHFMMRRANVRVVRCFQFELGVSDWIEGSGGTAHACFIVRWAVSVVEFLTGVHREGQVYPGVCTGIQTGQKQDDHHRFTWKNFQFPNKLFETNWKNVSIQKSQSLWRNVFKFSMEQSRPENCGFEKKWLTSVLKMIWVQKNSCVRLWSEPIKCSNNSTNGKIKFLFLTMKRKSPFLYIYDSDTLCRSCVEWW